MTNQPGKSAAQLRHVGNRWASAAMGLFCAGLALSLAGFIVPSATRPLVICAWVCFAPAFVALFLEIRAFRAAKRAGW